VKNKNIINDIIKNNNSNNSNKSTVFSELDKTKQKLLELNKPLGKAGDITINELITKGLDVVDTPLVKLITENVEVSTIGYYLSSMLVYKSIVNLYLKSAYNKSLPEALKHIPSTRAKEIAVFMVMGVPLVGGWM
jgi:hypothetical protein